MIDGTVLVRGYRRRFSRRADLGSDCSRVRSNVQAQCWLPANGRSGQNRCRTNCADRPTRRLDLDGSDRTFQRLPRPVRWRRPGLRKPLSSQRTKDFDGSGRQELAETFQALSASPQTNTKPSDLAPAHSKHSSRGQGRSRPAATAIDSLVKPSRFTASYDDQLRQLEQSRQSAYGGSISISSSWPSRSSGCNRDRQPCEGAARAGHPRPMG